MHKCNVLSINATLQAGQDVALEHLLNLGSMQHTLHIQTIIGQQCAYVSDACSSRATSMLLSQHFVSRTVDHVIMQSVQAHLNAFIKRMIAVQIVRSRMVQ